MIDEEINQLGVGFGVSLTTRTQTIVVQSIIEILIKETRMNSSSLKPRGRTNFKPTSMFEFKSLDAQLIVFFLSELRRSPRPRLPVVDPISSALHFSSMRRNNMKIVSNICRLSVHVVLVMYPFPW